MTAEKIAEMNTEANAKFVQLHTNPNDYRLGYDMFVSMLFSVEDDDYLYRVALIFYTWKCNGDVMEKEMVVLSMAMKVLQDAYDDQICD